MEPQDVNKTQIGCRIDRKLYERAREYCVARNLKMQDLVSEALEDYLSNLENFAPATKAT